MSTITLKTSISGQADVFGTVSYGTFNTRHPSLGNRLAAPLTTVWSLPPGCSEIGDVLGTCAPPNYAWAVVLDGYYSPGVCFSGYTIGCTATATSVNFEPVQPSETVAFCVKSGYKCRISSTSSYMRVEYADPTAFPSTVGWGEAVQIRWQSSDSAVLGSLYVTPSAIPGVSGVGGDGGLHSGAIAGIAVGGVVVLVCVLLATFMLFRKRRKHLVRGADAPTKALGPEELDGVTVSGELASAISGPARPGHTSVLPLSNRVPTEEVSELTGNIPVQRTQELSGSIVAGPTGLPSSNQDDPAEMVTNTSPAAPQPSVNPTDDTVDGLMARQAQLEERRLRLLQLQQIDEEQDAIRQRLSTLHQQQQQPPVRQYEMP